MGSGTWTTKGFADYTTKSRGVSLDTFETSNWSTQELYRARRLSDVLNPKNVMRECCDSEEHPNTVPVILALDVTGSMGSASVNVAQKLNQIMTDLYADSDIKDIEFCIMGIGDLAYDDAPVQMSQFESDVRIAEQLDALYFEGGGGGNSYESYTAAWYAGLFHCQLDCWKRGQRGIIITLGDELPNPYLPKSIGTVMQDHELQADVETATLLSAVLQKFDVHHISVNDPHSSYLYNNGNAGNLDKAWSELIGADHYHIASLDNLATTITDIIKNNNNSGYNSAQNTATEVTW